MKRRKFIKHFCSSLLMASHWKRIAISQPVIFQKSPTELMAYNRELSKRIYPKIKQLSIPVETVVLVFNPRGGFWEGKTRAQRLLRPALGKDGILVWADSNSGSTLRANRVNKTQSSKDLYYSKNHIWMKLKAGVCLLGITESEQSELGDIVYVKLPKIGDKFSAGETFGNIEGVIDLFELIAPVSGTVMEVNHDLTDNPELINKDPLGKGWLIKMRLSDKRQLRR